MSDIVTIHVWRRMAVDRPSRWHIPRNNRNLNWRLVSARSAGPVSNFKNFIFEAIEVHEVDEYSHEWLMSLGAF